MTVPKFDWAKPQSTAPSFDWAKIENEHKDQGLFDYISNLATNWFKTATVSQTLGRTPKEDPVFTDPEMIRIRNAIRLSQENSSGVDIAANDFLHTFDHIFDDFRQQFKAVAAAPGQLLHPIDFASGLARGLISPIGDLAELQSGVKLTEDDITALTPEEKAARIKSSVAFGAMIATGTLTSKLLAARLGTLPALGELGRLSAEELSAVSSLTAKGQLAKGLLKNSYVRAGLAAGVSGATYGLVSHANEPDQLAETLINGVMFAPLGAAFELLHGRGARVELRDYSKQAGELAQLRKVQDVLNKSFTDIVKQTEGLSVANNLAEAIFNSNIDRLPSFVIPSVDPAIIPTLLSTLPKDQKLITSIRDGKADVLVHNGSIDPAGEDFFKQTGLLKGGLVSWQGKDYLVQGIGPSGLINLIDPYERLSALEGYTPTKYNYITDRELIEAYKQARIKKAEHYVLRDEIRHLSTDRPPTEHIVTREGPLTRGRGYYHGGRYLGTAGSPYAPIEGRPFSDPSRGITYYDTRGLNIADPTDANVVNIIFDKAESIRGHIPGEFLDYRNKSLDENGIYWTTAESLPLFEAAHKLGYDAIRIIESGDKEGIPTSLFVWNLEKLKEISETRIEGFSHETQTIEPLGDYNRLYRGWRPTVNLDAASSADITTAIKEYLSHPGLSEGERSKFTKLFEQRLMREVVSRSEVQTRDLLDKAMEVAQELKASLSKMPMTIDRLQQIAESNGLTVSDHGTGKIVLRDVESGNSVASFDNVKDAAKFIDKTGQANGTELVQIGVPGEFLGLPPGTPPPPRNGIFYRFFNAANRKGLAASHLVRALDNFPLITRMHQFLTKVDTRNGTRFLANVFDRTQRFADMRTRQFASLIKKTEPFETALKKLDDASQEKVLQYAATMSPTEAAQIMLTKRPLSNVELGLITRITQNSIDLERVYKFMRERTKLKKEFKDDPQTLTQRVIQAEQAFGIDAEHRSIADDFETNTKTASIGTVATISRLIQDLTGTSAEFATKHKLSAEQIRLGNEIKTLFDGTAKEFGIPDTSLKQLLAQITHARLYYDGNLHNALRTDFPESPQFTRKFARTMDFDAIDRNPLTFIQRFMKGGSDVASGFQQAIDDARKARLEEIKKLPQAERQQVRNVTERYLSDLQGYPSGIDTFIQSSLEHFFKTMGLEKWVGPKTASHLVSGFLGLTNAAAIGARPIFGLLHFISSVSVSIFDRGPAYAGKVVANGTKALLDPTIRDEVRREGGLSTLSPMLSFSEAEYELQSSRRAIGKAITKTSEIGTKLTGLPYVFEMLSAGNYLTTKAEALGALTRYGRKELTWDKVRREIDLDKHYEPVQTEFKHLADASKNEEAAQFLARQAVETNVGRYQNANHPYMWGTIPGRLLGQFGSWPLWLRGTVTRMASTGTLAQRMRSLALLGSTWLLAKGAQEELGIDLHKVSAWEGLTWWGSPLEGITEDVRDAVRGSGYNNEAGKRRLAKLLPFKSDAYGNMSVTPSLFLPGSFAVDGIIQAISDLQDGDDRGWFELIGGRKAPEPKWGGF